MLIQSQQHFVAVSPELFSKKVLCDGHLPAYNARLLRMRGLGQFTEGLKPPIEFTRVLEFVWTDSPPRGTDDLLGGVSGYGMHPARG